MQQFTKQAKRPHYRNGRFYESGTEYQFLSYQVISSPNWVRMPFLTLGEVKDALDSIPLLWSCDEQDRLNANDIELIPDYCELRVYSESWLSELHKEWDEESRSWKDSEYTNRRILFGDTYENSAVRFTGIPSLSRQKDEERGDWLQRVEEQRKILKQNQIEVFQQKSALRDNQEQIRARIGLSTLPGRESTASAFL